MHDSEESKIVRFVSGLRREIQAIVELYEYSSLEKLVHLAIKVESQVLKKTTFKNTHIFGLKHASLVIAWNLHGLAYFFNCKMDWRKQWSMETKKELQRDLRTLKCRDGEW